MTPPRHLVLAGVSGLGLYALTGSWQGGVAALAAGVLPDADHFPKLLPRAMRKRVFWVFYLLHGWEYLGLLLAAAVLTSGQAVVSGVALGYASHLLSDYWVHDRRIPFYSTTYRLWRMLHQPSTTPSKRSP